MSWFEGQKTSASDKKLLVGWASVDKKLQPGLVLGSDVFSGKLSFPGRWLPTMVLGLELPHRYRDGWDGWDSDGWDSDGWDGLGAHHRWFFRIFLPIRNSQQVFFVCFFISSDEN